MTRRKWPRSPRLAFWLAVGLCASVALLAAVGLRASWEFQQSSRLLTQRRVDEAARLQVAALTRDMRAAQSTVLVSSTWDAEPQASHDIHELVASAFARYPYPEAFLTWDARRPSGVSFYTRADRPPAWVPAAGVPLLYPVRLVTVPDAADHVLAIIRRGASAGREYSIAETRIAGTDYQVVVLLRYTDRLRARLASARGFLVNLAWARSHYFGELTDQVARIAGESGDLRLTIVDDRGNAVVGRLATATGALANRRTFPLAFFDPVLAANPEPSTRNGQPGTGNPESPIPRSWTVQVSTPAASSLGAAVLGADVTVWVAALAAFVLALGLGVTARAMRMSAELAEMRAEFMSSVTHELKTPIASIQAMGETLSRGRLRDPRMQQDYGAVVSQEAKRLGRLVNNVLAYSRITDVADVYSFEALDVDDVLEGCLARFKRQLQEPGVSLTVDIPADVPSLHADRGAMDLLFDNLIDNAVRHSGPGPLRLQVTVRAEHGVVVIVIADSGAGIAADDLARVTQKFVRGRNAAPGGSGLGLAIVARIVADHGGTFTLDSAPGRGATARVVLPAAGERLERRPSVLSRASL
jgi:signal transduction histidine kinase